MTNKPKLTVCLTHDVDRVKKTYQYFSKPFQSLLKMNFNLFFKQLLSIFKKNPYWCFDKIITIEKKYNIKSTFYFLDESISFNLFNYDTWKLSLGRYKLDDKNIIKIIKKLDTEGFEIGLHGSYNSFKDINLLKNEKKKLENILNKKIIGIRQHYLNLDKDTWKLQAQAGFKYDSSFGHLRKIGFKENKFHPFRPFKDYFTVFPLVIMDANLFQNDQSITSILKECNKIIDIAIEKNAILVINWHQRVFNEQEFPKFKEIYEKLILKLKSKNANFQKLEKVYYDLNKK
jgi:peptidoglycan/xylan/chitin deacetylase (PgdA/CDA1 family)